MAALLIVVGLVVTVVAIARERRGLAHKVTDPLNALALARAFRLAIVGLAMTGVGAGWLWEVRALVVLSIVVAAEEVLETSVVVAALGAAVRRG
jgi:hypothetical protein